MPNQVTSMRRAPEGGQDEGGARRPAPPGPARRPRTTSAPSRRSRIAADADEEQQPVGHRVEDLARASTPGRSGGRCSRRPSRWCRGRRAARRPPARSSRPNSSQRNTGRQHSRTTEMTLGIVRMRSAPPSCSSPALSATALDGLRCALDGRRIFTRIIDGEHPGPVRVARRPRASPSCRSPRSRPGHTLVVPDRRGRPLDRPRPPTLAAHLHRRSPS